jgi:cytochrome c-type biogenesis protein CcmE
MGTEREEPVEPIELSQRKPRDEGGGVPPLVKVGIVFTMLAGALALLWFSTTAKDAFVYAKLVDEVLKEPKAYAGRELRVEGDLKQGSIQFKESPCEWRFVLGTPGKEMPVHFPQCIVPDTFKDGPGLKVTVQGQLHDQGYFVANQVIPRCPSKYEMQQMQKNGIAIPEEMKQLHDKELKIPGGLKPTS